MLSRTVVAGRISGIMGICAFWFYIHDILSNPMKDKSLTGWIIWLVVGFLIFKSYTMVGKDKNAPAEATSETADIEYEIGQIENALSHLHINAEGKLVRLPAPYEKG